MLTHDATNQSAFIAFLYHARSEEAKDENQTICIHAMDWADLFIKRIYGYPAHIYSHHRRCQRQSISSHHSERVSALDATRHDEDFKSRRVAILVEFEKNVATCFAFFVECHRDAEKSSVFECLCLATTVAPRFCSLSSTPLINGDVLS